MSSFKLAGLLLAATVPVFQGALPTSIRWAEEHSDSSMGFSTFTPLLFGQVLLCLVLVSALWVSYGAGAVKELRQPGYVLVLGIGIIYGVRLCFEVYAVTIVDASVYLAVMKSTLIHNLWMQSLFLRRCPDKMRISGTLLVAGCAVVYVQATTMEGDGIPLQGIAVSTAVALLDSLCANLFEMCTNNCLKQSADTNTDKLRCLIVFTAGRIISLAVGVIVFDIEFLDLPNGLFHGWTYHTILGPFLISVLRSVVNPASIMIIGALTTDVFASLNVIVAYVLERIIYGSEMDEASQITMLVTLAMACVSFALYEKSVEDAIKKSVDEIQADIADIRTSRVRTSRYMVEEV